MPNDPLELLKAAFHQDDAPAVDRILAEHPQFKGRINDPSGAFGSPAIVRVKSRAMLDVLIANGADIDAKSDWEPGGFGLLHTAPPDLALYAIERGARVDAHAAARLGLFDTLKQLVSANPEIVHERGGDGQSPLHFASTVEIAAYLLDHGANIDMRDLDHESAAAQWLIDSHNDVVRYLIERGCTTDILTASALGDTALVTRLLDRDPECIRMRVSSEWFPMIGDGAPTGGTIYQWKLGWYVSAHQVARKFGHAALFDYLMERSPHDVKLLTASWLGDEPLVDSLLAQQTPKWSDADNRHAAHAARNDEAEPLRLMLKSGISVMGRSQHRMTALHWACWQGNARAVETILAYNPSLEDADTEYEGTPLGAAIHGSENSWHPGRGDYAAVIDSLLNAGANPPKQLMGSEAVQQALRKHGVGQ